MAVNIPRMVFPCIEVQYKRFQVRSQMEIGECGV